MSEQIKKLTRWNIVHFEKNGSETVDEVKRKFDYFLYNEKYEITPHFGRIYSSMKKDVIEDIFGEIEKGLSKIYMVYIYQDSKTSDTEFEEQFHKFHGIVDRTFATNECLNDVNVHFMIIQNDLSFMVKVFNNMLEWENVERIKKITNDEHGIGEKFLKYSACESKKINMETTLLLSNLINLVESVEVDGYYRNTFSFFNSTRSMDLSKKYEDISYEGMIKDDKTKFELSKKAASAISRYKNNVEIEKFLNEFETKIKEKESKYE